MKKVNSKKTYSVAVVGAGWIGLGAELDLLRIPPRSHAQAATMSKRTKLVAIIDLDKKARVLAGKLHPGVKTFEKVEEMFKELIPDIVVIATDPKVHAKLIDVVSKSGVKAILCEKPISDSLSDAVRAVKLAKDRGVLLLVNHVRRFDPLVRKYRDYISGEYVRDTFIGAIRTANAYYDKGMFHGGTHYIDLLQFFLGPVKWVSGIKKSVSADDFVADCLLGFKNGATASLQYFDSNQFGLSEVTFIGERGKLHLRHMAGLEIEVIGTRACDDYSSYRELDYGKGKVENKSRSYLVEQLPHIIDCLEGRDNPVSTGDDALASLRVIFSIKKSCELGGQIVKIK